jgi:hypothetical protein
MTANGQGENIDGYADAPAPALQRAIGGRPWLSAVVLIVVYVAIGIRTGLGAYHFPRVDDAGRTGILLAWLSIMMLLAIGLWTLWVSSRLRWYQIRLRRSGESSDSPENENLVRSAHRLVEISHKVRPMVGWAMGLAVTVGAIGLGLLVVFFPHRPG